MIDEFNTNDSNTTDTYAFRFGTSNQIIYLSQQQLDLIPYLSVLVTHKDDFLPVQNDNSEFVLNNPIKYSWFISILRSINSSHSYTLFNEVSENDNILNVLYLSDYLGLQPVPLPYLKEENLVLSNHTITDEEQQRIHYHRANLSEIRQTAAEFIIAVARNEYQLNDFHTRKLILSLLNIILLHPAIFNARFRHHTFSIAKQRCYPYLLNNEQQHLHSCYSSTQKRERKHSIYLSDDHQYVPDQSINAFAWKGVSLSKEKQASCKNFQIANIKKDSNEMNSRKMKLNDLIRQKDALERESNDLTRQKNASERNLSDQKREMSLLERQMSDLERERRNLEREMNDLEREISDLERKRRNLERKRSDLESKMNDLERKMSDLERKRHDLEREMRNLEGESHDLEREISNRERQISDLERKLSDLEGQIHEIILSLHIDLYPGKNRRKNEARLTRARYLNKLPEQSKAGRFKYRSGPKAQKHQ